jgi:hypothetical protein
MAHQDLGRKKLTQLAADLEEFGWVEVAPRTEGRVMHLIMAPGPRKAKLGDMDKPSAPPPAAAPADQNTAS